MDYFLQMSAFENWVEYHSLTVTEELIWYKLMAINSKFGWSEWFFISNKQLMLKAHVNSEYTIIRARNKLKRLELIDYIKGKKGEPTKYKLFRLYGRDDCKFTAKNVVGNFDKDEKKVAKNVVDNAVKDIVIDDIKVKESNSRIEVMKVQYAEFVFMTEKEYSTLLNDERLGSVAAVKRCIDILDNYKGSSGKRYKSDYRTILSWVIDRYLSENDAGSVVKGQNLVSAKYQKKSKKDEQRERYLAKTKGLVFSK